ncbi:ABC transporter substrate-binding protein [Candidatus Njordibacter sp. Uisw_039]|uniref:substrate-binding periplasmic protein n=1 Tax=Candidatus Njordibacter sp. Uisw_039 TaxID=3230972 RepID=UPI003D4515E8
MINTVKNGCLTLICADLDAMPLFSTDDQGQRFGYEPAVAQILAQHLGLELNWLFTRWSDFELALFDNKADAIWCGCAITPTRKERFLFSRPYAAFDESVLVCCDANIASPSDLEGLQVAAIAGSTNMALAKSWLGCQQVAFSGQSDDVFADMIGALTTGEVDAVVDDEPAFGELLTDPRYKLAFTVKSANLWGAAMQKNQVELKKALDSALNSLIEAGSVSRIWRQHLAGITYPSHCFTKLQD